MKVEALRQRVAEGKVLATDKVWRDGMANWVDASSVPELFGTAAGVGGAHVPPPMPYATPYTLPGRPQDDIGQNAGIRMLIPVGRSGWAIASGYLGLLSVLGIFGPFAIVTGIIAVRDMKKHPHRHGMGRAIFGIVMGTLGTLMIGALLIFAVMSPR